MISKQRGFSLFEVVISFALISVAALGLLKLQASLAQKSTYTVQKLEALHFAERQMERYRTRAQDISGATGLIKFSELAQPTHCGSAIPELASSIYTLSCDVMDVPGSLAGEMKQIIVTVSWNKRTLDPYEVGASHAISLTTYISKFSEFDQ